LSTWYHKKKLSGTVRSVVQLLLTCGLKYLKYVVTLYAFPLALPMLRNGLTLWTQCYTRYHAAHCDITYLGDQFFLLFSRACPVNIRGHEKTEYTIKPIDNSLLENEKVYILQCFHTYIYLSIFFFGL
jgi:hypothetical protein